MRNYLDAIEAFTDSLLESLDLFEAPSIPETPYGYWIKPDGEFLIVEHENHHNVLRREGFDGTNPYPDAYAAGWIRVVAFWHTRDSEGRDTQQKQLAFSCRVDTVTVRALSSLRALVQDPIFEQFVGDLYGPGSGYAYKVFRDAALVIPAIRKERNKYHA